MPRLPSLTSALGGCTMDREANTKLIDEARDIGRLICPLPFQLEEAGAVERMPEDLMRAADVIGRLCDALEAGTAGKD